MDKRVGLIVLVIAGILVVGSCYGFLSVKSDKRSGNESGMAFPEMMNQLSRNLGAWGRLGKNEKKQAVEAVIALYKNKENVAILQPSDFYVGKIDETLAANPPAANMDIMALIRVLAVIEYDYYNGQNKDELAKKILGEKGYEENKKRLMNSQFAQK